MPHAAVLRPLSVASCDATPNLPTDIVDFRGFDSSIILVKGGNSHVHREFNGKLESSNVSRDSVSREIGRISCV